MKISENRIKRIVNETIADYFNKINQNSNLRSWAETDADNGISSEEGKRQRMMPSNASQSKGTIPTNDFKHHNYDDWRENYKPKGISYKEYMNMPL